MRFYHESAPQPALQQALALRGVCKKQGAFCLKDVSFALPMGAIMGFIGENGAGKTTTLKAILGIIRRDAGEVELLGGDPLSDRSLLEQVGVVFDECHFHAMLRPGDIDRILSGVYRSWDGALYRDTCRRFGLADNKTVGELSRGMTMKLSLAAALAHRPRLLLLDEATAGLDPIMREEILDLLLEFIQDEQHAVLLSSHITSDLDKVADYLTFIHQGEILFSRPRDVLLDDMGVLGCSEGQLARVDRARIVRVRRGAFGCEALVQGREEMRRRFPELALDPVTVEELMLFYVRGEKP